MHNYFKNKNVIISGGAGGLGKALTQKLIELGAKVAILDLNVDDVAPHKNVLAIALDITITTSLEKAIEQIHSKLGSIDILINNAGITHMSCFKDTPATLFNQIMDVNFTASVNLTRLCLPYLSKNVGQIVAISSVAGFAPLYGRAAYSASKHAMEGFFRSLASEIEDDDINVTIVCPSFVKTRPELTAQVNAGVSSPGAIKKNTNGEQLSPMFAAEKILLSISNKKKTLYLGKVSMIAHWLYMLVPNLYMKLMTKSAKKEF